MNLLVIIAFSISGVSQWLMIVSALFIFSLLIIMLDVPFGMEFKIHLVSGNSLEGACTLLIPTLRRSRLALSEQRRRSSSEYLSLRYRQLWTHLNALRRSSKPLSAKVRQKSCLELPFIRMAVKTSTGCLEDSVFICRDMKRYFCERLYKVAKIIFNYSSCSVEEWDMQPRFCITGHRVSIFLFFIQC